jgi:hypothetical protein
MKTSKHILQIFSEFELEKLWKTCYEVFVQGQKMNFGVWKRNMGGGKRNFHVDYSYNYFIVQTPQYDMDLIKGLKC